MYSELLQTDREDIALGTLCRGANFSVMLTQAIGPAWASERLEDHPRTAGIRRSIAQDRNTPETFLSLTVLTLIMMSPVQREYTSLSQTEIKS